MICYIPTKGRPKTNTYKLFENVGIEVLHFVEPQEYESYNVPNKINIKENDKGITYVRNYMLNYARENNHDWIIICDDDVRAFGVYNGKTVTKDAGIWKEIKKAAEKLPFELIGINYTQHAWHEKTSYSINKKFAEVCVLMNVAKIDWNYTDNTKEDRDFQLQTIQNGHGVLRFNHYWFSCPDVGTNKGGLHDLYKAKKDKLWAENLVKKWYPYAKLVRKNDRIDAKIDIKDYALSLNKTVK
jgi:hypothetical protein